MIMKKKYVNNLPKGKEVIGTEVRFEDGKLVVEIEFKDEFNPKDGDFLVSRNCKVFIFNGRSLGNMYGAYCLVNSFDEIIEDICTSTWTNKEGCRFATQEEKSAFLERLEKECHKTWNEDKKKLEDIRWTPNNGDVFYYIDANGDVKSAIRTALIYFLEEYPNCFKTEEAAQSYADKFKEMLKQSKSE